MAAALRSEGFHVLALELRGHGQTERFYPNVYYNFGVIEAQDLIRVSEWLEDRHPHIRQTGLIGFCWGGNIGLLAAWLDGCEPDDPGMTEKIAAHLTPPSRRRHFEAGLLTFSAILDWEDILDQADIEHSMWVEPIMYFFQRGVEGRMRYKGHPERSGSLRHLIQYEFARSFFGPSFPIEEAYRFLRMLPYKGRPHGDKLERVRVPTLIVHTINDPFASAQALANLMSFTQNPNVATLILRGGGHVGYFPYNRAYTYSLIVNFFDPERGAAPCQAGT
jgi:pimeloyl-ACP methyl ester carboxylesterase